MLKKFVLPIVGAVAGIALGPLTAGGAHPTRLCIRSINRREQFLDTSPVCDRLIDSPPAHGTGDQDKCADREEGCKAKAIVHERRTNSLGKDAEGNDKNAPDGDKCDAFG